MIAGVSDRRGDGGAQVIRYDHRPQNARNWVPDKADHVRPVQRIDIAAEHLPSARHIRIVSFDD